MPIFLVPALASALGFGAGFWVGDGFSSLLKILLALGVGYLFFTYVM